MSTEKYISDKAYKNSTIAGSEEIDRREFLKTVAVFGLTATVAVATAARFSKLIEQGSKSAPESSLEKTPTSIDVWKASNDNQNPDVERKIRVAKELFRPEVGSESNKLLYKENAQGIPKVDLAWSGVVIEDRESLENYLEENRNNEKKDVKLSKESKNTKTVDFFMSISTHESLTASGVEPVGWLARHMDYMNYLCIDNNLDTRIKMSSLLVINDELAQKLKYDTDSWVPQEESFPGNVDSRWVIEPGYNPRILKYYNKELDLDNGLMHELGHYAINLIDLYFYDLNDNNTTFESNWSQDKVDYSYSPHYLMAGSHVIQILSPFSIEMLKQIEKSEALNSYEWSKYMTEEALNEIGDTTLSFGKELANQSVSVYEAKPNGMTDPWTLHRKFEKDPDIVLTTDRVGDAVLPREIASGYVYSYQREDESGIVSFGKNFILDVDGKQAHLNSLDLLSKHWETSQ